MMKITAGLGSIDDYPELVQAGADELFCGYVPQTWSDRFGQGAPLNRREVMYYNVQVGAESELKILRNMIDAYHVPVSIALNALNYRPPQYPFLAEYVRRLLFLGFDRFIIADPALLWYLTKEGLAEICRIHVSGELGEMNADAAELCREWEADRIIFHRKVSLADMHSCVQEGRRRHPQRPMEYEAFVLNEMCHFHGGFCHSLHCDELTHMCRLPYRLGTYDAAADEMDDKDYMAYEVRDKTCTADEAEDMTQMTGKDMGSNRPEIITGASGCGLCALPELEKAGITHLKIVGRGNYSDRMQQDIRDVKRALHIWKACEGNLSGYKKAMRQELFPEGCSGHCYYRRGIPVP